MRLYHRTHTLLLAGQPLPSDLTLAQLLAILHDRGLSPGQSLLQFSMKLKTQKMTAYKSGMKTKLGGKGDAKKNSVGVIFLI